MKTWKRRWFILTDNCLYYFEYTTVSRVSGCRALQDSRREAGLCFPPAGQGAPRDHPTGEPQHQGGGRPTETRKLAFPRARSPQPARRPSAVTPFCLSPPELLRAL